jgi:uncharacterized phage protein gp47/JayE
MSKPIPSLNDLYTKLVTDIKTSLGIISGLLVKFVINGFATVVAAQVKLLYLYQVDVQRNQFPDTADPVAQGGTLERQGQIYLNRQPFPATNGDYNATVTGTMGAFIPAGTQFLSDGDSLSPGMLFTNNADYTLPGTSGVLDITSMNPGTDSALNVGDTLTPTSPIIGLDDSITIAAVNTAAVDAEDTEVYRQAILNAIILQPQGGAKADYRLWSADADGVRLAFPYVKNGEAGTVQVYIEAVTIDSTDGNGTPSGALLTAVAAVIAMNPDTTIPTNYRGRLPIQVNLEVLPILPVPVDVVIGGLVVNNSTIQASILANLQAFLYLIRPYIAGCDLPRDQNNTLTAVKMQSVISDTIGTSNSFLTFTMYVNGVAVNLFVFSLANIPYLRNVTYS